VETEKVEGDLRGGKTIEKGVLPGKGGGL